MDERASRVFAGLCVLVLLWIGVYWLWEPAGEGEAEVTLDAVPRSAGVTPRVVAIPPRQVPSSDQIIAGLDRGERGRGGVEDTAGTPTGAVSLRPTLKTEQDATSGDERVASNDRRSAPPMTSTMRVSPIGPLTTAQPAGAQPRASEPRVVPPTFREYTIKPGDTFERIAVAFYDDPSQWQAIAKANPLKDPRRIRVGDVIRVPVDPDNVQGRVAAAADDEPAGPSSDTAKPEPITYTVSPGDTLSGIAKRFYGSTGFADYIFFRNRDVLDSPDRLSVGQVLTIYPAPEEGN